MSAWYSERSGVLLLAVTSRSLFLNLPVATILIMAAVWFATHINIEAATSQPKRKGLNPDKDGRKAAVPTSPFLPEIPASGLQKPSKPWREQVGSEVVAGAWELLCGSIIQEVGQRLSCAISQLVSVAYSTPTPLFAACRKLPKHFFESQ